MRYNSVFFTMLCFLGVFTPFAAQAAVETTTPGIMGYYVEARTCDVYTGPCFANSEIGLTGKEAIMTWNVASGAWNGVTLDGLTVIAAVQANSTLGDTDSDPLPAKAVLIVDDRATDAQKDALVDLAKAYAGDLLGHIARIAFAPIEARIGSCSKNGCASVEAAGLVEINTRCLNGEDHVCGNEETWYPPLVAIDNAMPAYTEVASYEGNDLDVVWRDIDSRGAFLGTFSR